MTRSRKTTRSAIAIVLTLCLARAAGADHVWDRLGTEDIVAWLSGAEIDFDGAAWQRFLPSGQTIYRVGEAPSGSTSQGEWRAEAGNFCSRWPPADTWDCYAVEVDGAGGVRFVDSYGNVSTGRFVVFAP